MSESKYRALLAECRKFISCDDTESANRLYDKIEAALAEPVQAEPIKEGYRLVAVNEAFSELMHYPQRAEDKGNLDRLYYLVEPWEAFDYEYVDNAPTTQANAELVEALAKRREDNYRIDAHLAELAEALEHILKMQLRGFITLGNEATDKARAALAKYKEGL